MRQGTGAPDDEAVAVFRVHPCGLCCDPGRGDGACLQPPRLLRSRLGRALSPVHVGAERASKRRRTKAVCGGADDPNGANGARGRKPRHETILEANSGGGGYPDRGGLGGLRLPPASGLAAEASTPPHSCERNQPGQ